MKAPEDRAWRRRAACEGLAPELFFPPEREVGRAPLAWTPGPAQAVCRRCPVAEACKAWALTTRQQDGVWGGMTEQELRRLQRQPRRQAS